MESIPNPGAVPQRQTVQILAKQFQAKFSTKRECYNFLTLDCKAYLPHYHTVTIYFVSGRLFAIVETACFFLQLKDLISGHKKFVKAPDAAHLQIPQYDTLSIQKLYEFMNDHPETFRYFPDACEMKKVPKEWVGNMAYSILGDTFAAWVKAQINARNEKLRAHGDLYIELDPDVAAAFEASTAVACKYSAFLKQACFLLGPHLFSPSKNSDNARRFSPSWLSGPRFMRLYSTIFHS